MLILFYLQYSYLSDPSLYYNTIRYHSSNTEGGLKNLKRLNIESSTIKFFILYSLIDVLTTVEVKEKNNLEELLRNFCQEIIKFYRSAPMYSSAFKKYFNCDIDVYEGLMFYGILINYENYDRTEKLSGENIKVREIHAFLDALYKFYILDSVQFCLEPTDCFCFHFYIYFSSHVTSTPNCFKEITKIVDTSSLGNLDLAFFDSSFFHLVIPKDFANIENYLFKKKHVGIRMWDTIYFFIEFLNEHFHTKNPDYRRFRKELDEILNIFFIVQCKTKGSSCPLFFISNLNDKNNHIYLQAYNKTYINSSSIVDVYTEIENIIQVMCNYRKVKNNESPDKNLLHKTFVNAKIAFVDALNLVLISNGYEIKPVNGLEINPDITYKEYSQSADLKKNESQKNEQVLTEKFIGKKKNKKSDEINVAEAKINVLEPIRENSNIGSEKNIQKTSKFTNAQKCDTSIFKNTQNGLRQNTADFQEQSNNKATKDHELNKLAIIYQPEKNSTNSSGKLNLKQTNPTYISTKAKFDIKKEKKNLKAVKNQETKKFVSKNKESKLLDGSFNINPIKICQSKPYTKEISQRANSSTKFDLSHEKINIMTQEHALESSNDKQIASYDLKNVSCPMISTEREYTPKTYSSVVKYNQNQKNQNQQKLEMISSADSILTSKSKSTFLPLVFISPSSTIHSSSTITSSTSFTIPHPLICRLQPTTSYSPLPQPPSVFSPFSIPPPPLVLGHLQSMTLNSPPPKPPSVFFPFSIPPPPLQMQKPSLSTNPFLTSSENEDLQITKKHFVSDYNVIQQRGVLEQEKRKYFNFPPLLSHQTNFNPLSIQDTQIISMNNNNPMFYKATDSMPIKQETKIPEHPEEQKKCLLEISEQNNGKNSMFDYNPSSYGIIWEPLSSRI